MATDESKPLQCTSIYALSKKDQEEMTLLFGRTYGMPVVALRYFNIYGTRQALSNPYTGVAAIFASRLLNRRAPMIFEDGEQMRDFVSVHDVVQANLLAMERSEGRWHGAEHRLRRVRSRSAEVAGELTRLPGRDDSGRDHRQVSRRRYSPLLCRYLGGAQAAGLPAAIPVLPTASGELVDGLRSQTAVDKARWSMVTESLSAFGLTA